MARTHVEFGSFFALLLGLGRPVRRLMGHHDAVAAVRRRGRLQEPVESLLLILLRAPAEPGMPELIVHVVRLPAGGLAGAGHLQTDEVAVEKTGSCLNVGSYQKRLFSKDALGRIGAVASKARELNYLFTMPWSDVGQRLLPAPQLFVFSEKMRRNSSI